MNVYDFKLTDEEVSSITALDEQARLCNKFQFFDQANLFA